MYIYYILYIYIYIHYTFYVALHLLCCYAQVFLESTPIFHIIFSYFILVVFFYLLRFVKPFLVKVWKYIFLYYFNAYCTKQILMSSPLLEPTSRYFLVCLVVYFSISWEPFGFLWNFSQVFLIILWLLSN